MISSQSPNPLGERWRTALAVTVMCCAVLAVYCPWSVLAGRHRVAGTDFLQLHARRMAFAREALFGPARELPGWYPRELMGTPFWSNVQNFPFIPTRLLVFALFQPDAAFAPGVALSAVLAALFTFLLCRRLGLSRVASAAAGWTFACCGFFAARVFVGHLPLLEAYPALPALLWLVDRAAHARFPETPTASAVGPKRFDARLLTLGLACAAFALAGHPQLTIYALGAAAAYAVWLAPSRRGLVVVTAMLLGVGAAAFALYPMAKLTARSTRVLALRPAKNDLAMPYGRLGALVQPWKDGWPATLPRTSGPVPFTGYPGDEYFWDTVSYVGLAPLAAAGALAALCVVRRRAPGRGEVFFALLGAAALVLALPFVKDALAHLPGTFLRSPARLMYVVCFTLCLALAAGLDQLLRGRRAWWGLAAAAVVLALHAVDVASHARQFIHTYAAEPQSIRADQYAELKQVIGDGRIAFDYTLVTPLNRAFDDVGFFDSVMLARPYRFLLDTAGLSPTLNVQALSGAQLGARALRACGVRVVFTSAQRPDLPLAAQPAPDVRIYVLDDAAPRVAFFAPRYCFTVTPDEMRARLRDPTWPLTTTLLLTDQVPPAPATTSNAPPAVNYRRASEDEMAVTVTAPEPGYVRVLESWDPGWQARLDGQPVPVVSGNDAFLAVLVPAGAHELRFTFHTPGARAGAAIALTSAALLACLAAVAHRLA